MSKQVIATESDRPCSSQHLDAEPDRLFESRNTHYDDEEFSLDI